MQLNLHHQAHFLAAQQIVNRDFMLFVESESIRLLEKFSQQALEDISCLTLFPSPIPWLYPKIACAKLPRRP
jgi:hypothetical protein